MNQYQEVSKSVETCVFVSFLGLLGATFPKIMILGIIQTTASHTLSYNLASITSLFHGFIL